MMNNLKIARDHNRCSNQTRPGRDGNAYSLDIMDGTSSRFIGLVRMRKSSQTAATFSLSRNRARCSSRGFAGGLAIIGSGYGGCFAAC